MHLRITTVSPVLVGFLAVGCSDGGRDGDMFGTGVSESGADAGDGPGGGTDGSGDGSSGSSGSSGGSGESGDGGDTAGDDGTGDGGIRYDVGEGDDSPGSEGGNGEGCAKVDFLFVIDNSGSMGDEQQNLINSFPNFMQSIKNNVEAQDYHILVTDMDAADKWGSRWAGCETKCVDPTKTCSMGTLGAMPCSEFLMTTGPTQCDVTMGAGRVYSKDVPPQYCPISGGKRYLTDQQPNLEQNFECIASMGAWGGGELGMDAMLAATSADMNAAGGCNDGFLRDDAVLVVTIITDEEDNMDSAGDPASWRADLLARKGGNETAVVTLGLVGDFTLPGSPCPPDSMPGGKGAEFSPRLREFVQLFGTRGFLGSVCEPDYGPFFQQAVDVIDAACDEFVPEG